MRKLSFLLFLSFLSFSPNVLAWQFDMVGVSEPGLVYEIDSDTGSSNLIGASGFNRVNCLAKSPAGVYYAISGRSSSTPSRVFTIDEATGAGTLLTTINLFDVRALAYDNGLLYIFEDASTEMLYTLDPNTFALNFIGDTGFDNIQGATFADGVLYAWEVNGDALLVVDPLTAATVDVDPLTNTNDLDVQSICSDSVGNLWGGRGELFALDIGTGATKLVGGAGTLDLRGLEFKSNGGGFSLNPSGSCPGPMSLDAKGATFTGTVAYLYAVGQGGFVIPGGKPCPGTTLGLSGNGLGLAARVRANSFGKIVQTFNIPAKACGKVSVQLLDLASCTTSNVVDL